MPWPEYCSIFSLFTFVNLTDMKIFLGALLLTLSMGANALIIDESSFGDFSQDPEAPVEIGTFDLGLNQVSGTINTFEVIDAWNATLLATQTVVGVSIQIHSLTDIAIVVAGNGIDDDLAASLSAAGVFDVDLPTVPENFFEGFWVASATIAGGDFVFDPFGSVDYTWFVDIGVRPIIEPVPAPYSFTLLLLGLGLLARRTRVR